MPRGKTTKPKTKVPPKDTTTTTKKATTTAINIPAMEGTKTTVGSKRKQKAVQGAVSNEENDVPAPKRQRATTSKATEETDRAVLVTEPPQAEPAIEEAKITKISHPSHRTDHGEVMTFGQGDIGQLGLGEDIVERKKPSPVGGELEGKNVVQVVCGGMHTVALTDDGEVYTWGCNDECALGRSTEDGEEFSPGLVATLKDVSVVQVSAGDCHTTALTSTGLVYCWGVFRDSNGQFGLLKPGPPSPTPMVVYISANNPAVKVVSGSDHIVILTTRGDIHTLGCAEQGQLGRVPECFSTRGGRKGIQYLLDPQIVRFKKSRGVKANNFCDVFCGSYTTFAYTKSGHVYAWGLNNYGQLGVDDNELRFMPELISNDWIESIEDTDSITRQSHDLEISGGQHHSLVCHKGNVFVMGRKEYGRLGFGENSDTEPLVPTKLPNISDVTTVAAGSVCSFAVSQSGLVYSWGMGTSLQLGNGIEDDIWEPTVIAGKKIENRRIISVTSGGQHTALLVSLAA